jgi:hypothetical protein
MPRDQLTATVQYHFPVICADADAVTAYNGFQLVHDKVQQTWSRELSIGDLSLRLRPFPELHAQNVFLANPAWAKNKLSKGSIDLRWDSSNLTLAGKIPLDANLHSHELQMNVRPDRYCEVSMSTEAIAPVPSRQPCYSAGAAKKPDLLLFRLYDNQVPECSLRTAALRRCANAT